VVCGDIIVFLFIGLNIIKQAGAELCQEENLTRNALDTGQSTLNSGWEGSANLHRGHLMVCVCVGGGGD